MPDEKRDEKKEMSGSVKSVLATVSAGLIAWAASMIWSGFDRIAQSQQAIDSRLRKLEESDAKWGTLAEMDRKLREYEIQAGIVRWLLEHGKFAEVAKPSDVPLRLPKIEAVDPEEYRKIQQQRFPNEPMKGK